MPPHHHQHMSHQETGTFGKSFGNEFGAGCGRMLLNLMGCGLFLVVIAAIGGGIIWYLNQKPSGDPKPPGGSQGVTPTDKDKPTDGTKTDKDKGAAAQTGKLVLKISAPVGPNVSAWVEVDGARAADWKVGTKEVELTLPAGKHRVVVKSSVLKRPPQTFYDQEVIISPDEAVIRQVQ